MEPEESIDDSYPPSSQVETEAIKSDEAYANQMKSVFNLLDDDKAKEEYSIKISKDLFGSNKNRKRPSPRNQDEEE